MRIIECRVTNEYVRGAGQVIGAAGSHHDVALRLAFDEMWHGLAKSIVWLDAQGENPTLQLLTTELLAEGEAEVYIVPIPAEPKALEGKARATIRGAKVEGETETAATLSATAEFSVLRSDYVTDAEAPEIITPDVATQIRAEIENIKEDIVEARAAATEAKASEEAAREAQTAAEEAKEAAEQAAEEIGDSALLSESWAVGGTGTRAGEDTDNSKYYAGQAKTAQEATETAKSTAETAAADAEAAQTAAEGAAAIATAAAVESAALTETAIQAAQSAAADAQTALNAANSAEAAIRQTEANAESAAESAAEAAADAARAEAAAEQAESVVGGDFATKTEAQQYANTAEQNANRYTDEKLQDIPTPDVSWQISTHNNDATAHPAIREALNNHTTNGDIHVTADDKTKWNGKADLINGKVPAAQLPEGYAEATSIIFTTLTAAGWTGAGPYTQFVSIEEVTEDDSITVGLSGATAEETEAAAKAALTTPEKAAAGGFTVTANGEKPAIDLPIMVILWGNDIYTIEEPVSLEMLGVTASAAELNYSEGLTGNVQAQINAILAAAGGGARIETGSYVGTGASTFQLTASFEPQVMIIFGYQNRNATTNTNPANMYSVINSGLGMGWYNLSGAAMTTGGAAGITKEGNTVSLSAGANTHLNYSGGTYDYVLFG